jgi:hypothetical protein
MAGAIPIEASELPDFHQIVVIQLNNIDNPLDDKPIFYAERDTVIEAVHAKADAGTPSLTLKTTASGTAAVNTALTLGASFAAATIDKTNNVIAAGDSVTADFNTVAVDGVVIQLRIRTRIG